jgi:hypothetical protein
MGMGKPMRESTAHPVVSPPLPSPPLPFPPPSWASRRQERLGDILSEYPHPCPAHAGNPATLTSMAPHTGEGDSGRSPQGGGRRPRGS